MSKLEIEFEITGLKFRISGEKDAVPVALASLQRQVANLAQTVATTTGALDGNVTVVAQEPKISPTIEGVKTLSPPARTKRSRKSAAGSRKGLEVMDFRHDADKYGFPDQDWNTAKKAMWLLYVLEQQTGTAEVSAPVLAATFNKYFRQAGDIRANNISRDLGAAKGRNSYVNNDPTKDPETWFLLTTGKATMQQLIENPNEVAAGQ